MGYFSFEIKNIDTECILPFLKGKNYPFYLDSGSYFKNIGRYSFFGFDPFVTFKFKNGLVEIVEDGFQKEIKDDPFTFLNFIFNKFKCDDRGKQFPFQGGFVGYLGYELGNYIEDIKDNRVDDYNLPDFYFAGYDTICCYDHLADKFYIAGYDRGQYFSDKVDKFKCELEKFYDFKAVQDSTLFSIGQSLTSNFSKDDYKRTINRAKEYIFAGDIYQVNISQRFQTSFCGDPYQFYRVFRKVSPAPFGAFLDYGEFQILSNSPERYLMTNGQYIETRPIKGTRKRGISSVEDTKLIEELQNSAKDRAEHLMIVDLERNDLGRIAEFNSVTVSEFESIESYANVHHLVSTVSAKIDKRWTVIDCIKNSFPGGSITGAPKIRSMEIISELEPTYRSVYTGAVGYIGFDGDIDLNIAIRTAIIKGNNIYFQVGGGIVADSDPEDEYIETIVKGESFTKTLKELSNG